MPPRTPAESATVRNPSGPFATHLKNAGLSPASVTTYRGFVACYLAAGGEPDNVGSMAAWLAAKADGRSEGAIRPRAAALRAWIAFRGGDPSALQKPDGPRAPTQKRAPLSPADLAAYRLAADAQTPALRCALTLLPLTGLRVAEVCALRWVDYVTRRVWQKGTQGEERPVTVPGFRVPADPGARPPEPARFIPAVDAARAALDEYRAFAVPSAFVFPSALDAGEPLAVTAVQAALRELRPDGAWSGDRLRRSYVRTV